MTYSELEKVFQDHEAEYPKNHLTAHITFTEDSFSEPYSLLSRTYVVSSDNKAFRPNMGGYSIFGSSLDGTDPCVRLERCMAEERGGKDGWKVENCDILEHMRDVCAIPHRERTPQDDGTVGYFFGDTSVRVRESVRDGRTRLEPVAGDQAACGEWNKLDELRLKGYCSLLERAINDEA